MYFLRWSGETETKKGERGGREEAERNVSSFLSSCRFLVLSDICFTKGKSSFVVNTGDAGCKLKGKNRVIFWLSTLVNHHLIVEQNEDIKLAHTNIQKWHKSTHIHLSHCFSVLFSWHALLVLVFLHHFWSSQKFGTREREHESKTYIRWSTSYRSLVSPRTHRDMGGSETEREMKRERGGVRARERERTVTT